MLFPFHLVSPSPWPFIAGMMLMALLSSFLFAFKFLVWWPSIVSLMCVLFLMYSWFRDINREAEMNGAHNSMVILGLKLGFILFIVSEIMLFFSFFWTYFHLAISPANGCGLSWPSNSLEVINPFQIPLLNTLILLSSGVTVTLSHYNMIMNMSMGTSLFLTVMLGMYFTGLQLLEYKTSSFSISSSGFGSIFFFATGFHGAHVLVGSVFLLVNFGRTMNNYITHSMHLALEMSIYYWHFVDVVWLFLFSFMYMWGK